MHDLARALVAFFAIIGFTGLGLCLAIIIKVVFSKPELPTLPDRELLQRLDQLHPNALDRRWGGWNGVNAVSIQGRDGFVVQVAREGEREVRVIIHQPDRSSAYAIVPLAFFKIQVARLNRLPEES